MLRRIFTKQIRGTSLIGANLVRATLGDARLVEANLSGADLSRTHLSGANLREARLSGTNLFGARLSRASLIGADLSGADLTRAYLGGADLHAALLRGTNMRQATVGWTGFGALDLSTVRGLEEVTHEGPSTIGIDTLYLSGPGGIANQFLLGAGVPQDFLDYLPPSLLGSTFEFYSCFISYSNKDEEFTRRLYSDLLAENVRVWFAPEDLKIGDRTRRVIHDKIRFHDKLLVVLTKNSVDSDWVEEEVEAALQKERKERISALFPIRLDDAVMESRRGWAEVVRDRNIGDFRNWEDRQRYQSSFERLLRNLTSADNNVPGSGREEDGEL